MQTHSELSTESINTIVPREPRRVLDLDVEVMRLSDERMSRAHVIDLTEHGLCVETDLVLEIGEGIGVELPAQLASGGRVSIYAEVRWIGRGRLGLKIGGMLPHHRERLRRMLNAEISVH